MGKPEVADDIFQTGIFHLLFGGPIPVKRVNLADNEEGFGVHTYGVTDLLHGGLTKAETHSKAGEHPKDRETEVQKVCHLHGRTYGRY